MTHNIKNNQPLIDQSNSFEAGQNGERNVIPVELPVDELLDFIANRDQHITYKKERLNYSRREKLLVKEVGDLKIKIATLETEKEFKKRENARNFVLNLTAIICTGIGCSIVANSLQNGTGWLFIGVGALLYLVSVFK